MKLGIALITHNRLDYTKRTLKHLRNSTDEYYYLVVADNASTDGTQKYLKNLKGRGKLDDILLNDENLYPAKATNEAWETIIDDYPEVTHLMRLDNDMYLSQGWWHAVENYFANIPELGQLGIDHEAIEHPKAKLRERVINGMTINPWPGCVGGPNIIKREIWDAGARYPDLRWDDGRNSPLQEDSQFSKIIQNMGYITGHMTENLCRTFANESNWADYPDYYKKTMQERGYIDNVKKIEGIDGKTN